MNHQPEKPEQSENLPPSTSPGSWVHLRCRQLEGTLSDDLTLGVWPITHQRVTRGWGYLVNEELTAQNIQWPRDNPAALDPLAHSFRIAFYYRIWNSGDALKAFFRNHTVQASFRVTERWRDPPEGRFDFDQTGNNVLGGHALGIQRPIFYYPRPKKWLDDDFFSGPNTWGETWGNRGFYAMRYDFFDRENYESWAITFTHNSPKLYGSGIQHVTWPPIGDIDLKVFVYDIIDTSTDNRLAWTIGVIRRGELEINDLYVKPEARGRGYAKQMISQFRKTAEYYRTRLRFWIPFADVDNLQSLDCIRNFFAKQNLGFEPSPFPSSAFCAVVGGSPEIPSFQIPPKPAHFFSGKKANWTDLQKQFNVEDDFLNHAKSIFGQHAETLRRLA